MKSLTTKLKKLKRKRGLLRTKKESLKHNTSKGHEVLVTLKRWILDMEKSGWNILKEILGKRSLFVWVFTF